MKTTNFNWLLTIFAVISFAFTSNADVCTKTFTESGLDDDPTTVTITPADLIDCTGGGTINSITLVNTAGSFTDANCGSQFDFTLVVDGSIVIADGCQADFDGTAISAGFSTIEVYSNDEDGWNMDLVTITFDLQIDYTPASCPAAYAQNVTDILANSATLSWTKGDVETNWNVEYGVNGFTQGTGTMLTPADTFVNVTGLYPGTKYDFYVQANCGADQSIWVGPHSFTTECGAITSFPYTEDFEIFSIPMCWGETTTPSGYLGWAAHGAGYDGLCIMFDSETNDGTTSLLNTETFDFSGETDMKLRFWWKNPSGGNFKVVLSTDGGATYPVTLADNLTGVSTFEKKVIDLTSYCGAGYTNVVIGFEGTSNNNTNSYIYLDKLSIASCLTPIEQYVTGILTTSSTLSWTSGYEEVNWNIEYGAVGFIQGTGTTVATTDTFTNVTGLTASTIYDFYVQSDCGSGDASTWIGPYSFATACAGASTLPVTEGFESGFDKFMNANGNSNDYTIETTIVKEGSQSAHITYSNDCYDSLIVRCPIDLTGNADPKLSFWHIAKSEGQYDTCYVKISVDGGATYTHLPTSTYEGTGQYGHFSLSYFDEDSYPEWGTGYETPDNTWWKHEVFSLSNYNTESDVRFLFLLKSDDSEQKAGWYIDDIKIENITCTAPTAQNVTDILGNSATLSWTKGAAETNWNIEYGPTGFSQGTGTTLAATDTFTNVTGLTATTAYDFYVQADCGSGDDSYWVGPYSFVTSCGVISSFPYTEDFESTSTPICWGETRTPASTYGWATNTSGYDANCFRFDSYFNQNGNISLLNSETFDFSGETNLELKFWWKNPTGGNFKVVLSTDGGATYPVTLADNLTGVSTYEEKIIDLSPYCGAGNTNIVIGFEGTSNYGSGDAYIYLDKLSIKEPDFTDLALVMPGNEDYSDCSFTGQDTIPFFVENVGNTVIPANDTIFGWYKIDAVPVVADTFILVADLNPTHTMFAMFAQTGNLAGYTTHTFKEYFEYEPGTDMNQVNDTTEGTVTHYELTVDLGGTNDTLQVASYPHTLDAGAGFDSYLWNNASTNQTLDVSADGWYNVLVSDTNDCDATDTVYVVLATGINTIENTSLSIYPNPNNGEFTLNATFNTNVDLTVEMVNIDGKTIYAKEFNCVNAINENIDVDGYAKGIYYIRIVNNDFVKQEKVVIY